MTSSTKLKIKYAPQPIEEIRVERKGFKDLILTKTESGKVSVKVDKEHLQATLVTKDKAAELSEALTLIAKAGVYAGN